MGLANAGIKLNLELWQRGLFKDIKSVVDIGSQELYIKEDDFKYPYQGSYMSERLGNYGYQLQFSADLPSRTYTRFSVDSRDFGLDRLIS